MKKKKILDNILDAVAALAIVVLLVYVLLQPTQKQEGIVLNESMWKCVNYNQVQMINETKFIEHNCRFTDAEKLAKQMGVKIGNMTDRKATICKESNEGVYYWMNGTLCTEYKMIDEYARSYDVWI